MGKLDRQKKLEKKLREEANLEIPKGGPDRSGNRERVEVVYMVQSRVEAWVEHENEVIVAASPTLKTMIGLHLQEVRARRMVLLMRPVPRPEPLIELTDAVR